MTRIIDFTQDFSDFLSDLIIENHEQLMESFEEWKKTDPRKEIAQLHQHTFIEQGCQIMTITSVTGTIELEE